MPVKSHAGHIVANQPNTAPRKKSMNKGGSPSGVNKPPQLAHKAMKNKTVCTLY